MYSTKFKNDNSVVVFIDLSGKEPHIHIYMTSRSQGGLTISTLARNGRVVSAVPTLCAIFSNYIINTSE